HYTMSLPMKVLIMILASIEIVSFISLIFARIKDRAAKTALTLSLTSGVVTILTGPYMASLLGASPALGYYLVGFGVFLLWFSFLHLPMHRLRPFVGYFTMHAALIAGFAVSLMFFLYRMPWILEAGTGLTVTGIIMGGFHYIVADADKREKA